MGYALTLILLLPFTMSLNGYTVMKLWHWFIVPLGMNPITWIHAMGISLVVSYLTYQIDSFETKSDTDKSGAIVYSFLKPAFALLFGKIIFEIMT